MPWVVHMVSISWSAIHFLTFFFLKIFLEKRHLSELYKTFENGTQVLLINMKSTVLSTEEMDDMVKDTIYYLLALFFLYFLVTALWQYCIDTEKVVKYIKYCDCKSDHTTMQMFELVM